MIIHNQKRKYLLSVLGEFVDKFILNYTLDTESMSTENVDKSTSAADDKTGDNFVFDYACAILVYVLMARNFQDASREGDGERVFRSYKFQLLLF